MESAFAWLNQLIEAFYKFIPHIVIVRATHGGVKWVRGNKIKLLKPGLHFYWPLTTEIEVIVTARQTLAIPDQVLMTKDGQKITIKTLVVYRIPDPLKAIGQNNWDVDTTVNDMTQAAVAKVVLRHTLSEIAEGVRDDVIIKTLTHEVRRELRRFGVHISRCKLVDFADCKVYKLMTSNADKQGMATSQFYG